MSDPLETFTAILGDKHRWSFVGRKHERAQVMILRSDPLAPGDIVHLPAAAAKVFGGTWVLENRWTDFSEFDIQVFVIHKERT